MCVPCHTTAACIRNVTTIWVRSGVLLWRTGFSVGLAVRQLCQKQRGLSAQLGALFKSTPICRLKVPFTGQTLKGHLRQSDYSSPAGVAGILNFHYKRVSADLDIV